MWELLVKWRPSDECDGVQQLRGLHRLPGLPLLHGLLLPAEPLQSQGRKQFCRLQPLFSRHFSDLILSSEPPIKSRQAGNKTKKLLNFLLAWQAAGLIRTLSGIIKSLLSSQVDIWVLVASLPPPTLPLYTHQDEYREKFTNLTKFGSKRANFGLVPTTNRSRTWREKVYNSHCCWLIPRPDIYKAQFFLSWETKAARLWGNFREICC